MDHGGIELEVCLEGWRASCTSFTTPLAGWPWASLSLGVSSADLG